MRKPVLFVAVAAVAFAMPALANASSIRPAALPMAGTASVVAAQPGDTPPPAAVKVHKKSNFLPIAGLAVLVGGGIGAAVGSGGSSSPS